MRGDGNFDVLLIGGPQPQRFNAGEDRLNVRVAEAALTICRRAVFAVPTVAVVGSGNQDDWEANVLRGAGQPEVRTAQTLVGLVEPVLSAMRTQGRLRPDADTRFLAALLVDACLMSLLHGGHRDQREVLRDWQDRFSLLMHGALAPGATLESGEPAPPAGSVPPPGAVGGRSTLEEGAFPASPARAQDRPADATIP